MNNIKKFLVGLLSMVLLVGLTLPFSSASAEELENVGDNQTTSEIPEVLKPIDISDLQYDVNKNLSEEQIAERFDWINSNYEINQPFSLEDTEFIRAYASPSTANAPTNNGGISTYDLKFGNSASQSFSKSKTAQGVSIKIAGSVRAEVNILNHSYGAKYKTTVSSGSSKIKSIRNNVKASAYGMVGTSGTYVGLVHSSSIGATSGSKPTSWSIDKTKEYSAALVVYVYVNAYTTVNTTSGSFDLYAF